MTTSMLDQWAKDQETADAVIPADSESVELPDNGDHFEVGIGVVDGERDLLPA